MPPTADFVQQVVAELHKVRSDPESAKTVCGSLLDHSLSRNPSLPCKPLVLSHLSALTVVSTHPDVINQAADACAALASCIARIDGNHVAASFLDALCTALSDLRTTRLSDPVRFLFTFDASHVGVQQPVPTSPRLQVHASRRSLHNALILLRATVCASPADDRAARHARTMWHGVGSATRLNVACAASHPALLAGCSGAAIASECSQTLEDLVRDVPLDSRALYAIRERVCAALHVHASAVSSDQLIPQRAQLIVTLLNVLSAVCGSSGICPRLWACIGIPAIAHSSHDDLYTAARKIAVSGLIAAQPHPHPFPPCQPGREPLIDVRPDVTSATLAEILLYNAIHEAIPDQPIANHLAVLQRLCFLAAIRGGLWTCRCTFSLWTRLVSVILTRVTRALRTLSDVDVDERDGVFNLVASALDLVMLVARTAPKCDPNSNDNSSQLRATFPFDGSQVAEDDARIWLHTVDASIDAIQSTLRTSSTRNNSDFVCAKLALDKVACLCRSSQSPHASVYAYLISDGMSRRLCDAYFVALDEALIRTDQADGPSLVASFLDCYHSISAINSDVDRGVSVLDRLIGIVSSFRSSHPRLVASAFDAIAALISISAECDTLRDTPSAGFVRKRCSLEVWDKCLAATHPTVDDVQLDDRIHGAAARCIGRLAVHAPESRLDQAIKILVQCVWHTSSVAARKNAFRSVVVFCTCDGETPPSPILARLFLAQLESQLGSTTLRGVEMTDSSFLDEDPSLLGLIASVEFDEKNLKKASALALDFLLHGAVTELVNLGDKLDDFNLESNATSLSEQQDALLESARSHDALAYYNTLLSLAGMAFDPRSSLFQDDDQEDAKPWLEKSLRDDFALVWPVHAPRTALDSELASYLGTRLKDWLPLALSRLLQNYRHFSVTAVLLMEKPDALWKKAVRHALGAALRAGDEWVVAELSTRVGETEKKLVDRVCADVLAGSLLEQSDAIDAQDGPNGLIVDIMEMDVRRLLSVKNSKIVQRLVLELGGSREEQAIIALESLAARLPRRPRVGDLISQHFLLVMDNIDQALLEDNADNADKIGYLAILQGVIRLANVSLRMYVHKIFSSLKGNLVSKTANDAFKAKAVEVWATLISSLGAENVAPHLSSMLATFLPYVDTYSHSFVPTLESLFLTGKSKLEPYFGEIRLLFRTVKHRSLRNITKILEEAPTDVRLNEDVVMVDVDESAKHEFRTDLDRFSSRCNQLLEFAVQHESSDIRRIALGQLLETLKANRDHYSALLDSLTDVESSSSTPLLASLVTNLTSLVADSKYGCELKALECLGELGAVDPALIAPHAETCLKQRTNSVKNLHTAQLRVHELARYLLQDHLAPALWRTSPSDAGSRHNRVGLSIQELLKAMNCGRETAERARQISPNGRLGHDGVGFWILLNETARNAAQPYLEEPFDAKTYESVMGTNKRFDIDAACSPIWSKMADEGRSVALVEWRRNVTFQAIDYVYGDGCYGDLFSAVRPALRYEVGVTAAILPYVIAAGMKREEKKFQKSSRFTDFVANELRCALSADAGAVQCVFSLVDTLRVWRDVRAESAGGKLFTDRRNKVRSSSGRRSMDTVESCIEYVRRKDCLTPIVDISGFAHSKLSLLYQAKAALRARSYARVVFLAEQHIRYLRGASDNKLWAVDMPKLLRRADVRGTQSSESYEQEQETLKILQDALAGLEDSDGVKGVAALRTTSSLDELITDSEASGDYESALLIYERAFRESRNNAKLHSGYLRCLCTFGHWETMLTHAMGLVAQSDPFEENNADRSVVLSLGIDAAWRLGRWDKIDDLCETGKPIVSVVNVSSVVPQIGAAVGRSLLCLQKKKWNEVHSIVEEARKNILKHASHAAVEGYSLAYPMLIHAHALADVEDLAMFLGDVDVASNSRHSRCELTRMNCRTKATALSLKVREPLLSLRRSCLEILGDTSGAANVCVELAELARENGNLRVATSTATHAFSYASQDGAVSFASTAEMARIQRARGDCAGALLRIKKLISEMTSTVGTSQGTPKRRRRQSLSNEDEIRIRLCAAHILAGQWTEEDRSESSEVILSHFANAAEYWPTSEHAFYALGRHYDSLWEAAVNTENRTQLSDGRYTRVVSQSQGSRIDRRSSRLKRNFFEYVPLIVDNFTAALKNGHARMFEALPRLLTVCFDFYSIQAKARNKDAGIQGVEQLVNTAIQGAFKAIPMYMWMSVVPQLMSRLCHESKIVQDLLTHMLAKLLVEFPNQGIWLIATSSEIQTTKRKDAVLKVLNKAALMHKKMVRKSQASAGTDETERKREENMLNKYIHNGLKVIKELIRICEKEGKSRNKMKITFVQELKSLRKAMERVSLMVPNLKDLTVTLPVSQPGNYGLIHDNPSSNLKHSPFAREPVTLVDVEDDVMIMSSLMAPRRISFIGSDGKQYRFLAKRENHGDMRKDSRLMEFVTVVNRLLAKDGQTRARRLSLTTYAVIPLTEQTGIIEWVNDLNALRNVLTSEMTRDGRKVEGTVLQSHYERHSVKSRFLTEFAFPQHPPVLDRWFVRQFGGTDARRWLDARALWCRTVAAWSMTGYIVGLGDRHAENVLLETTTGRAVHVDFAMLFEKGASLKVPEVVPFRLTPNMVAAFGIAGTEGGFRSSCEVVLRVLRANVDALMGTIEAFVHDPLFEGGKASDALKTNATVRNKLKGIVDASGIALSVQGQVQKLIADATSHERLGAMYIWWSAWL